MKSAVIYCGQHCKLTYNVLDTYFTNLSEMFFPLNHCKIWLNISKCPQCVEELRHHDNGAHARKKTRPETSASALHVRENSKPTFLYSSALNGPTPPLDKLMAMDSCLTKLHQFGTHDKLSDEACHFQHASATPSQTTVNDSVASFSSGTSGTGTKVRTGSVDPVGNRLVQGRSDRSPFYSYPDC
jgi:hypothetical protein